MEKTYISRRQLFTLIYAYILSNELTRGIYLYHYRQSTWIPVLLAIPLSCFLFFVYSFIYKNTDYPDFKTAMERILGKFFSKILIFIYFFYFLLLFALKLRDLVELVSIYTMQDSPFWMLYAFYLLVAIYCAVKGIEVIARYSGLVFAITFFSFVLFFVLLAIVNEPEFQNLLPFMPHGFLEFVNPTLRMAYSVPLGELFPILVIFQYVRPEQKKQAFKTSYFGIAAIGVTLLIISIANIVYLEAEALILGYAPIVRLWRRIDIEDFIQRLDLVMVNILLLNVMVKSGVLFVAVKAMADGIKEIKKGQIIFYGLLSIGLMALLLFLARDYPKILNIRFRILIPYLISAFEVFIPILVVIISFFRKKQAAGAEKQVEYNI
mgnify:CR=1 FL=1